MPTNCQHIGCNKPATHKVVLELRVHDRHKPAISDAVVYVCDEHMDVEWDDVVTPESWKQICDGMKAKGYHAPSRGYSNIRIIPIASLL